MSEYQNSLQMCQVVKDAVSINAADECERLAVENRRMSHLLNAIRRRVSLVDMEVRAINNQLNPKVKSRKGLPMPI